MRPQARIWHKALRRPAAGRPAGRSPRPVLIQAPRRGSSWLRRHPGQFEYWLTHAGTGRLIADLKQEAPADAAAEAITPTP